MGFALCLLYIVTYYLTPNTVFGALAEYRIELIIAVLAAMVSVPAMARSFVFKTPQTLALAGTAVAVAMSLVVGEHWLGGALPAFLAFIPNAFAYFIVCVNCKSRRRFQLVATTLMFVCLFVIVRGLIEARTPRSPQQPPSEEEDAFSYQMPMDTGKGEVLYRLRGLGEIHDPNDFAQLLVSVIPLTFVLWREGKTARNLILVIAPAAMMIYGVFLTHSRGALLALVAIVIAAGRRKLGTVWSLVIGGVVFAGASALNFTGGRDISAEAGADRTSLWSQGLEVFKAHPLFGVGFGRLGDYTDVHLTAHNSLVVCAAELGLFGLISWCLFLLPSIRDAIALASPASVTEPKQTNVAEPYGAFTKKREILDKAEINRIGQLIFLSFVGFLVAAWFLSRSYVLTLFLLGSLVEIVYEMALERGMIGARLPLKRVFPRSCLLAFVFVLAIYVLLRGVNLTH